MLLRVQHDFHIRCGSCCTFDSKTTSVTRGAGTTNPSGTHEFISDLYWGSCFSIFSFLCRVLYLYFFLLSLHCLPFYLRRLITPLVSSKDFWSGQIIWTKIVSTWAYEYKIVHTLTKYQVEFINNKRILLPKTLDSDLKAYILKIETTSVTVSLILWVYGATFYITSDTISWKPFFICGEP
jgi:hypothetical protein